MVYINLALLWPVLNFFHSNMDNIIHVWHLVIIFATFSLLASLSYCGLYYWVLHKYRARLLIVYVFIIYSSFVFGPICDYVDIALIQKFSIQIRFTYVYVTLQVIIILLLFFMKFNISVFERFLRVFILFTLLPTVCLIGLQSWPTGPSKSFCPGETKSENFLVNFKEKPDVFLILLDGYPRLDTLKEELALDNSDFQEMLNKQGFWIADNSNANYHFTKASMSSCFMMQYHCPTDTYFKGKSQFSFPIIGDNNVVKVFKRNGYEFLFAPPGMLAELDCYGYEDTCIRKGFNIDVLKTFFEATVLRGINYKDPCYLEPSDLDPYIKNISDPKKPRFIYAHFLQVHDAITTQNGSIVKSEEVVNVYNEETKSQYLRSIKSMNSRITKLVDSIQKENPSAIIIILSDHGPAVQFNTDLPEAVRKTFWSQDNKLTKRDIFNRMANFVAIYLPKPLKERSGHESLFSSDITNVNVFRVLFSLLSGESISMLPNKAYLISQAPSSNLYHIKSELTEPFAKKKCSS